MTPTKYDVIGVGYDGTRRPDPRIAERLLRLLHPPSGRSHVYLDLACGTGNYTGRLAAAQLQMLGIDHSATMLTVARDKTTGLRWCQADVGGLPFPSRTFAGAICTNAIHHFTDLTVAFAEVGRVLRPGARFVILTATRAQMCGYWLNAYFPVALDRSIAQMHRDDDVREGLAAGGFGLVETEAYDIPPDPVDLFLYSGKHRPELYLDQAVRAGISTFASLADPEEVEAGVARLRRDIASGEIQRVVERFRDSTAAVGDYTFWVAERLAGVEPQHP